MKTASERVLFYCPNKATVKVPLQEKGGESMARRKRRFETAQQLTDEWEAYKNLCDNQMVLTHDFSSKNSEFVSAELRRAITYTIEGFCVYAKISRAAFYENYAKDKRYIDIVTRMHEECGVDARKKFELGIIPERLAPLWMSKYGYSSKTPVDLEEQQARMNVLKSKIPEEDTGSGDDGFLDALIGTAKDDWSSDEKDSDI
jgi:hypothetical protein